jgi:hypothetical protein
MSYPPTPHFVPPPVPETGGKPRNTLGFVAFILSIIGLVMCGVLSPFTMILSLIALHKPPRDYAITGVVVSFIGLLFFSLVGLGVWQAAKESEANQKVCQKNLVMIHRAKGEWARENGAANGAEPDWEDLEDYLEYSPNCPEWGDYEIGAIGEYPSCDMKDAPWHPHTFPVRSATP